MPLDNFGLRDAFLSEHTMFTPRFFELPDEIPSSYSIPWLNNIRNGYPRILEFSKKFAIWATNANYDNGKLEPILTKLVWRLSEELVKAQNRKANLADLYSVILGQLYLFHQFATHNENSIPHERIQDFIGVIIRDLEDSLDQTHLKKLLTSLELVNDELRNIDERVNATPEQNTKNMFYNMRNAFAQNIVDDLLNAYNIEDDVKIIYQAAIFNSYANVFAFKDVVMPEGAGDFLAANHELIAEFKNKFESRFIKEFANHYMEFLLGAVVNEVPNPITGEPMFETTSEENPFLTSQWYNETLSKIGDESPNLRILDNTTSKNENKNDKSTSDNILLDWRTTHLMFLSLFSRFINNGFMQIVHEQELSIPNSIIGTDIFVRKVGQHLLINSKQTDIRYQPFDHVLTETVLGYKQDYRSKIQPTLTELWQIKEFLLYKTLLQVDELYITAIHCLQNLNEQYEIFQARKEECPIPYLASSTTEHPTPIRNFADAIENILTFFNFNISESAKQVLLKNNFENIMMFLQAVFADKGLIDQYKKQNAFTIQDLLINALKADLDNFVIEILQTMSATQPLTEIFLETGKNNASKIHIEKIILNETILMAFSNDAKVLNSSWEVGGLIQPLLHIAINHYSVAGILKLLDEGIPHTDPISAQRENKIIYCYPGHALVAAINKNPNLTEDAAINILNKLLEKGADLSLPDSNGKTILDYARSQNFPKITGWWQEKIQIQPAKTGLKRRHDTLFRSTEDKFELDEKDKFALMEICVRTNVILSFLIHDVKIDDHFYAQLCDIRPDDNLATQRNECVRQFNALFCSETNSEGRYQRFDFQKLSTFTKNLPKEMLTATFFNAEKDDFASQVLAIIANKFPGFIDELAISIQQHNFPEFRRQLNEGMKADLNLIVSKEMDRFMSDMQNSKRVKLNR